MSASQPRRDWSAAARFYEYTQAADPPVAPIAPDVFPPERHAEGATRVIPWDLSSALGVPGPATAPGLSANFVRIRGGESLSTAPMASSQLAYVIRGRGVSRVAGEDLPWNHGDLFTLPMAGAVEHAAAEEAVLYWVHDAPLLAYLGAMPATPRFRATLYTRERIASEVAHVRAAAARGAAQPRGGDLRQRRHRRDHDRDPLPVVAVQCHRLLGTVQKPHRHQSVARSTSASALMRGSTPSCPEIPRAPQGRSWSSPSARRLAPGRGLHHAPGLVALAPQRIGRGRPGATPIQDAGLRTTYLRTLDIQFTR